MTIHPIVSFKFLDILLHGLQEIKRRRKMALKRVGSPPQPLDAEMGVRAAAKKTLRFLATASASSSYVPEKCIKSNSSCDSVGFAHDENFYDTHTSESNMINNRAVEMRPVSRGQECSQLSVDLHVPAAASSLILSHDESMERGSRN
jgi:hypothetical protein